MRPIDPPTIAAAAALLFCAVGLAACLIPAGRALALDPVEALRAQWRGDSGFCESPQPGLGRVGIC